MAFIPNPAVKKTVNHINGIKTDNTVENLEWATDSEQQYHAYATGLRKPTMHNCKAVRCVDTGEVFASAAEASRSLGLSKMAVTVSMRMRCKCAGMNWEYIN